MERNEKDRLTVVEVITEQNAEAIHKLTITIEKLSDIVAREDAHIKETLNRLTQTATECQMRHEAFMKTLDEKKETLAIMQAKLDYKADKKEVKALKDALLKIMWWIVFGVMAAGGSAIITSLRGV
jgi:small-conductance mechanosensitive channel